MREPLLTNFMVCVRVCMCESLCVRVHIQLNLKCKNSKKIYILHFSMSNFLFCPSVCSKIVSKVPNNSSC